MSPNADAVLGATTALPEPLLGGCASLAMAKTPEKEPEIIGPEVDHAFNDPELSSLEFLRAIQRDRKIPLSVRIDAAKAAAVYEHPRLAQVNQDMTVGATIRIEGGLPNLPGTNIIMPNDSKPSGNPVSGIKGNGADKGEH